QVDLPWHARGGVLFCPGNVAPLLSLLAGRVVVTIHDLSSHYFPQAYDWKFRLFYRLMTPMIIRFSSRIIVISNSEASAIAQVYPGIRRNMSPIIQNGGFGADILQKIPAIEPKKIDRPYGLYVGSLSRRKNFPALFIAALDFVRATDFNFVFIGGTSEALRQTGAFIPEELLGRIIFVGQMNDTAELVSWYKGASLFVFPSLYEASPFPPLEAMACGCPALCSCIPSLKERCGDAVLYCDPYSAADISREMVRLATDSGLRLMLLRSAEERLRLFTWDACAAATLNVLEEVTAAP
ncbi:MAG: glycosyltransferase family 4 protein, partial [Bdellovibrionales bacterium]|nr:glycosyltransferase family 4 protein [Bdellovibrionales bacterium]